MEPSAKGNLEGKVNFARGEISSGARAPENVYMGISPGASQTSCKVWLASGERHRCSNEAKTRKPLKFDGVPKLPNRSQPLWAEFHHIVGDMFNKFFRLSIHALLRRFSPTNLCDSAQMAIFA